MTTRRWFHPDDVAQEMGVSLETVYRAIRSGQLRAKRAGRLYLIAPADLEAYYAALPDGAREQAAPTRQAPAPGAGGGRVRLYDIAAVERERLAARAGSQ